MAGITDEELDSYLPPPPSALPGMQRTPDVIRADHIVRDIYNRHGIEPGTPLEEAQAKIIQHAQSKGLLDENGQPTHAWANPEERAAAREQYAAQGKTPEEVQKRWEESIYLLPEQGFDYHQNYGRDAAFLRSLPAPNPAGRDLGTRGVTKEGMALTGALQSWDSSNNARLFRKNWREGTYADMGGFGGGVANAVVNPDLPTGSYMHMSEVVPDTVRMAGSGETGLSDSYKAARAKQLANTQLRISSPAPILREKDQSTVAQRLKELREQVASADVPSSEERWKRTVGFAPPAFIRNSVDFATSMLDPTILFPLGKAAKVAAMPTKTAAMQAAKNVVAKEAVKDAVKDFGVEQGVGHALTAAFPSPATEYKTDEQVAQANENRSMLYGLLNRDSGVSRADDAAYKRLQESGKAPISYR